MQAGGAIIIATVIVGLAIAGISVMLMRAAAWGLLRSPFSGSLMTARLTDTATLPHGRKTKGEQQQHCDKTGEHGASMRIAWVYVPVSAQFPRLVGTSTSCGNEAKLPEAALPLIIAPDTDQESPLPPGWGTAPPQRRSAGRDAAGVIFVG